MPTPLSTPKAGDDPFSPPRAPLQDSPRKPAAAWKAVLLGFVTDTGVSLILRVVYMIAWGIWFTAHGFQSEWVVALMGHQSELAPVYTFGAVLLSSFCSILGGVVCTRLYCRADFRLGLILAGLSSAVGLMTSYQYYSIVENGLLIALTFGMVLLGIRVGRVTTT